MPALTSATSNRGSDGFKAAARVWPTQATADHVLPYLLVALNGLAVGAVLTWLSSLRITFDVQRMRLKAEGFVPGGISLHNCMLPHGPDAIAFEKASTVVKCVVCGSDLATPAGGRANIKAEIVQELQ